MHVNVRPTYQLTLGTPFTFYISGAGDQGVDARVKIFDQIK